MFVVVPSLIFMTYAQFQVGQVDKAEAQMNKLLEHGKEDESGKFAHKDSFSANHDRPDLPIRPLVRDLLNIQFILHRTILGFIKRQRSWELKRKRSNKLLIKTVALKKLFGLQKSDLSISFI